MLLLLVNKTVDLSNLWVKEDIRGASKADGISSWSDCFDQMARNEELIVEGKWRTKEANAYFDD